MARFTDTVLGAQQNWIHDLAKGEIHPEANKLLELNAGNEPQQLVEESAIEFLISLRDQLGEYAKVFNGYSDGATRFQEVKIYNIAQSAADFMMFRNQIKLLVCNSAHGVIQIQFANHVRGNMAIDGQVHSSSAAAQLPAGASELLAQVGPFRDVTWAFQGEKVSPDQVARFYFSEFVKATREVKTSKSGNQFLLEQIKSLLEQKGLNL